MRYAVRLSHHVRNPIGHRSRRIVAGGLLYNLFVERHRHGRDAYRVLERKMRSNHGVQVFPSSDDVAAVSRTSPFTGFHQPRTRMRFVRSLPVRTITPASNFPSISINSPRLVTHVWCHTDRVAS